MRKLLLLVFAFLLFFLISASFVSAQVLLGDQNIESSLDSNAAGIAQAFQATAGASGSLNSISLYVDPSSTAGQIAIGLYNDAGGHPSALLTQAVFTPQAGVWNAVSVPATAVVAGTNYWIAVLGLGSGRPFFRDIMTGCTSEGSASSSLTALPGTWSTGAIWGACGLSAFGSNNNSAPVVSPILLGDQNVETGLDTHSSGHAEAFQTIAAQTGNLDSVSMYVDTTSTATQVEIGLYSDSGGQPSALLTEATFAPQAGAWNAVSVPAVQVAASTNYWIAVMGVGAGRLVFRASGTSCNSVGSPFGETTLPSAWTSAQSYNRCLVSAFGSNVPTTPVVSLTVSPTSIALVPGGTQQFTATVTGSNNTAVSWSATGGTVSATGLYTAPSTPGTYTVTATSAADSTQSASATVTVSAPVAVAISPSVLTISLGGTQQFTATVTGTSNTGVTWSASGGTITPSGLFTAPPTLIGVYTVTATSVADPTKSASATITVIAAVGHSATLTWQASTSSVAGYNVYRGATSGGPYTAINSSLQAGTSYVDSTVLPGLTYFYVVTAVDSSGNESVNSNEVQAVIPLL